MTRGAICDTLINMKTSIHSRIIGWLFRFLQVQFFITTVSLPILASWGLPFSLLSPLGNLLFLPVLVLFLFLSSIIFFLELCCIPNGIFIYFLEKITSWWTSALSFGNGTWYLIGLGTPPKLFLILVPLFAFLIISHKKTNSVRRSIILLALLLTTSVLYLKLLHKPHTLFETIACNGGQVTILRTKNKTAVIDQGFVGKKISAPSWVEYTLIPEIIKKTGSNTIDHLIVLQPGIMTFRALEKLSGTMNIGTLYLPAWKGTLNKNGWRSFFFMKRALEKQGTHIVRIGNQKKRIPLTQNDNIVIESTGQNLSYQEATYPALLATGQIDNKTFTLYSAKWKGTE